MRAAVVMEVFQQLAKVVRQQNAQGDLPDFITPPLLRIAESSAEFADRAEQVAILVHSPHPRPDESALLRRSGTS